MYEHYVLWCGSKYGYQNDICLPVSLIFQATILPDEVESTETNNINGTSPRHLTFDVSYIHVFMECLHH